MTLSFKSYLLLNGSLLFFISFNNVFNFNLIDLTLILSILLYSIKWNESEWLVPLLLFTWGIFQDILLGMNLELKVLIPFTQLLQLFPVLLV